MDSKSKILFYGFSSTDLSKLDIKCDMINIDDQKENMLIKNILKIKISKNISEGKKEKIILFHNLNDKALNSIIPSIRKHFGKDPILAVVTPTSINWTFSDLKKELMQEREYFNNMQSEKGKGNE